MHRRAAPLSLPAPPPPGEKGGDGIPSSLAPAGSKNSATSASKPQTPLIGVPRAAENPRAVARQILIPVNEPGPSVTRMFVISDPGERTRSDPDGDAVEVARRQPALLQQPVERRDELRGGAPVIREHRLRRRPPAPDDGDARPARGCLEPEDIHAFIASTEKTEKNSRSRRAHPRPAVSRSPRGAIPLQPPPSAARLFACAPRTVIRRLFSPVTSISISMRSSGRSAAIRSAHSIAITPPRSR